MDFPVGLEMETYSVGEWYNIVKVIGATSLGCC